MMEVKESTKNLFSSWHSIFAQLGVNNLQRFQISNHDPLFYVDQAVAKLELLYSKSAALIFDLLFVLVLSLTTFPEQNEKERGNNSSGQALLPTEYLDFTN